MTTYTDATHTSGGARLAIIGSTALTLAALAAIGWNLWTEQQGTERAPATTTSAQTLPSAAATSEPAPAFMYLVDAPEDAAFLRQFLAQLNDRRRALGRARGGDMVVETTLDAKGAAALPRPPNMTIYDLRQPVAGGRTMESSTRP